MAGYTNSTYRLFALRLGADFAYTEMVSAEGLLASTKLTVKKLLDDEDWGHVVLQLFSGNATAVEKAAHLAAELGFRALDVNMGCPVRKVVRRGAGAALLRDRQKAKDVVKAALQAGLPVSVKVRSGFESNDEWPQVLELLLALEELGVCAVAIHPRCAKQMYSGSASWELVAEAVRALRVPVFGSGDVLSAACAKKLLDETGAAGVMLARGAIGNFPIFEQTRAILVGEEPKAASFGKRARIMLEFIAAEARRVGERVAVEWSKKFLVKLIKGMPGARALRGALAYVHSIKDVKELLDQVASGKTIEEG